MKALSPQRCPGLKYARFLICHLLQHGPSDGVARSPYSTIFAAADPSDLSLGQWSLNRVLKHC